MFFYLRLQPFLFLVYANDVPDLIKAIVSLFADDTKLYKFLKDIGSTEQLQNDIDAMVTWAKTWKMKFNIEKCKVMHLGRTNTCHTYSMFDPSTNMDKPLKVTSCEKDLGVYVDKELTVSIHTTNQVNKANQLVGMIRRTFTYLDKYSFKNLFVSIVRPHLEYCSVVYQPRLLKDKRAIENVLRRATKLVPGMKNLSYEQRLQQLNMPSMRYRFRRGDVIEVYKWIHKAYKCHHTLFELNDNTITRGHPYKLVKKHCRLELRKNFFGLRVVDTWNNLPSEIVCAVSLNQFKNMLDNHWLNQKFIYD